MGRGCSGVIVRSFNSILLLVKNSACIADAGVKLTVLRISTSRSLLSCDRRARRRPSSGWEWILISCPRPVPTSSSSWSTTLRGAYGRVPATRLRAACYRPSHRSSSTKASTCSTSATPAIASAGDGRLHGRRRDGDQSYRMVRSVRRVQRLLPGLFRVVAAAVLTRHGGRRR